MVYGSNSQYATRLGDFSIIVAEKKQNEKQAINDDGRWDWEL